jgi:SAM-dependent methyltransferase
LGEAPDEALEEAARLAREQAPSLCSGCDWNHGLWPTLRLLCLVTEPALHGAFLRPALAAVPGEGPRVLLSGAADHALLAQVLAAYAGRSPRITVLDICETPLMLNRWYAGRRGVAIETQRSDILDYEAAGAFDVVCTHAFLGHFDPPKRAALMRKWHSLLQPGGKVITVNRLRPGREPQWVAFSVDQVWAYRARVEEAARARGLQVPGLGRAAEAYAGRQAMFPLGSAMELGALLREAAFEVERMAVAPLASAKRQQVSLPTVPGSDDYVLLIAVRC